MSVPPQNVTLLLHQWRGGDQGALDELMPVVYDELRRLAQRCLYAERPDHTLRATELVNEAYMRLIDAEVGCNIACTSTPSPRGAARIPVGPCQIANRQKRGGEAPNFRSTKRSWWDQRHRRRAFAIWTTRCSAWRSTTAARRKLVQLLYLRRPDLRRGLRRADHLTRDGPSRIEHWRRPGCIGKSRAGRATQR